MIGAAASRIFCSLSIVYNGKNEDRSDKKWSTQEEPGRQ